MQLNSASRLHWHNNRLSFLPLVFQDTESNILGVYSHGTTPVLCACLQPVGTYKGYPTKEESWD